MLADSANVSLAGEYQSTNSSVEFGRAKDSSVLQIATGSIQWKGTRFDGDGHISIATNVTVVEVAESTIGSGVKLLFQDITQTKVQKWRGNKWPQQTVDLRRAADGGVYMCNQHGTAGEASGCDRSAECFNEPLGGVSCRYALFQCCMHVLPALLAP